MSSAPAMDPRQVPVIQVDTHLPPVPAVRLQPDALRQRFLVPPVWQPELVAEKQFMDRAPMHAAVLIPIVMHTAPTVLLTQRTAHMSTHAGQIAFPGGKLDEEDVDAAAAARREAYEEVGLAPDGLEVLGQLPLYTTGSAFLVTPVVALVQPGFKVLPNAQEVSDVFEVPLSFLMDPAHHQHHQLLWQGVERHWLSMPYHDGLRERYIWGATAGMLRNFYRFLSA
ncbi:CoA pyrophosphatase [Rhodoferax fermentans]|uniref:CoA pyrophosphatase n=1 Tax=Rhodoferax fermentans TaxID=28066 RepID=A0A1T1AQ57_RHOFE|nr:CoA pyrophosphatase [Rhodoferax fermentans]MBK1683485.1 CoA pyrophosphatase [Rhodoferax fermentans]OOV06239.1 CoA pyrophosphatase [Rhodoferax fermentans]